MIIHQFGYHRARTANDVTEMIEQLGPGTRLLAGGTDLVVQMRADLVKPSNLIDLAGVPGLRSIDWQGSGEVRIGARVTMTQLEEDPRVRERFPALVDGASEVGSRQIKNRATLVGNLANASPAADTVPALHIYEAMVHIAGPDGDRVVPVEKFASGPRQTVLRDCEWVPSITLPALEKNGSCYVKLGRTRGVDLAVLGVACLVGEDDVRVAFASAAPTVVRAPTVERVLSGETSPQTVREELTDAAEADLSPIDDVRASAAYRLAMAPVIAERAWERAREHYESR